jgi:endoglucanase
MHEEPFGFLKSILETPSVSGFEQPVGRLIRRRMEPVADELRTDVHGNVIVALNPGGSPRVMLAGHMDQIGLMVKYVNDEGFLYFDPVGGIDNSVLSGLRVTVHAARGPVQGVIGKKPVHVMKPDERDKAKVEITDLAIDIGARSKAEALSRVSIADPVTFALGVTRLGEDFIAGPGLDDKVGAFVVMEALRLAAEGGTLKCALFAVATVQEEIGLRGATTSAYGLDAQVGIAVDVTAASDHPGVDKKVAGEISLGRGPVIRLGPNINPVLGRLLVESAVSREIPHQIGDAPKATGTDANAMQISRSGMATGLIGLPNRYMHTPVEVCALADLENAARLIAEAVGRVDDGVSFIPA